MTYPRFQFSKYIRFSQRSCATYGTSGKDTYGYTEISANYIKILCFLTQKCLKIARANFRSYLYIHMCLCHSCNKWHKFKNGHNSVGKCVNA